MEEEKTVIVNESKGKKEVAKTAKALKLLQVTYAPIESIHPNAYNPNRQSEHEFGLLLKSMTDDGFTQPVLVQEQTREIIDGEHRWRAARKLGYKEIPVVFTSMTAEQMRVATLRHNRARGEEDVELTAAMLRDLETMGSLEWAQKALDLDDVEIQRLIKDIPAPEALKSEQFSKPWVFKSDVSGGGSADVVSMTIEAADRLRISEKALAKAKTDEERKQARTDERIYRLNLVYTDEEAALVRKILGTEPAAKIYEYCKAEQQKREAIEK
jgi:ParB/RepB/Spo0J family partition protein